MEHEDLNGKAGTPLRAAARRGLRAPPPCFCVSAVILLFAFTTAFAQNYSVGWHIIDGGGGTSAGSVYSVSGASGVTNPIVPPATVPAKFYRVFRP